MPSPVQEIDLEAAPGRRRFHRADPDPDLSCLVTEDWEVQGILSAFRETLLPNAKVEVMVNLGPLHHLFRDGERRLCEEAHGNLRVALRGAMSQPSNGVWKTLWTMDLTRK